VLIVLSGGTGFVGRALVPLLVARHEVVVIARDPTKLRAAGDRPALVQADLESGDGMDRLPARADAVVHLAQGSGPYPAAARSLFGVNAVGTGRLLEYAERAGARRFVFTSTGTVYAPSRMPLAEDASLAASPEFYVLTKRVAEDLVTAAAERLSTLVARLFAPYGPGQRNRLIPRVVETVRDGRSVTLRDGGSPRLNPIWIDDLTDILARATEGAGEGIINVAGPRAVGIREIAEIAGTTLGVTPRFEEDPNPTSGDLVADIGRMVSVFGSRALVAPEDGIARVAREMAAVASA